MYTKCLFGTWIPGRYTEVAFIQGWPSFRGGRYTEVAFIQGWPSFRGGRYTEVAFIQGWPSFRGGLHSGVAVKRFHCSSNSVFIYRYSVDLVLDKQVVNKDSLRDGKTRKKAKVEIRKKFEER